MDSRDETAPEAGISPLLPPSLHGKVKHMHLAQIIHTTLRHTHGCPTPKDTRADGCVANSSYLHATVGSLTTKATLASFFHSIALVPFLFLNHSGFVLLKRCFFREQKINTPDRKHWNVTSLGVKIRSFFTTTLCLGSMSLSARARVQTQHRAQRPAVTSDSFTLCPLSTRPSPPAHTRPLWLISDRNYVSTLKMIKRLIKVKLTFNKMPKND